MDERKKFRLADVILSVICVVFVAEAAAPVASIGNSQYFWWLFMMVAFLLPYGMISSELGTTYPGDGGLYDWIHKAFPETKWAARASWYYWINFPLWMASLAVVCPELLSVLTGLRFGWGARLLIELAFIWVVTWIACYPVCDSILILNISAAIKMLLALTVGVLGIVYVARSGFVNDMAPRTFLPGFDLHSLSYISVIIFNFLGFEVVCTYADNMRDPKRQIPQAIVSGGIVIALIYLFSAFGIGAAIPTQEISEDSGLIDAVALMTGRTSGWFVGAVALLFLITLFGNMISWSMGVNATAAYAAARGDMPAVFSRRWAKNDMPVGAALTSGVVASAVCILGVIIELLSPASSLFWSFFALNLVMLLLSYVQLTTLAADTVALKSELTVLQAENVSLTAQHEQMFDMATVKEVAAAAGMAKPTSSQITYLDLDSEDSAVVYRTETPSVFSRILSSLHHGVYAVVEYFD